MAKWLTLLCCLLGTLTQAEVLQDPTVRKRIEDTGSLIIGNTPAEFAAQIAAEFQVYKDVVVKQKLVLE